MNRTTLIAAQDAHLDRLPLRRFALLVYQAVTNTLGPDPTSNITLTTGYNTLLLLILSLAITPLRCSRRASPGSSSSAACSASSRSSTPRCTWPPTLPSTSNFDCNVIQDRHHQAPLHHRRFRRVAAARAAGCNLDHLGHPQARRQALEPPAQAGLPRGHLRNHPLLVAGQARRLTPDDISPLILAVLLLARPGA